jgi:hypothetical protein
MAELVTAVVGIPCLSSFSHLFDVFLGELLGYATVLDRPVHFREIIGL